VESDTAIEEKGKRKKKKGMEKVEKVSSRIT